MPHLKHLTVWCDCYTTANSISADINKDGHYPHYQLKLEIERDLITQVISILQDIESEMTRGAF